MPRPRVTRRLDWTSLPIHPLLVAAYPVVFLFALNAADQVTFDPLWEPLAMAVGGAALTLLVLGLVTRDWRRAGLLTTVLVVGFFGYGHAWNAVSGVFSNQWPLIGAWGLAIVVGLFAAWRAGRAAQAVTQGLNLVASLALLLNAWTLGGSVVVAFGAALPAEDVNEIELAPADPADLPDVYYIILDRYAGSAALRETYDFDNEPFLTALEERGFRIARRAHANYIKTPLSLVSSMNLDYLDADELMAEADSGGDREPIHRRLSQHFVVSTALKELGYRYIQLGNWWSPTAQNVDADRVFRYDGQTEFASVLAQTTLLRAFREPEAAPTDPWDWDVLREHARYQMATLAEIPDIAGPKFVFAHLLVPHSPYLIDADGSAMDRAQVASQGNRDSYVRYLRWGNARMLEIVDRIIAGSGEDAVIMIQADEGPFPARYDANDWAFRWRDATDAELEEKFGILYAMRVPGADLDAAGFSDTITPVNTFRVIFNARFGTDLPLLPDRVLAHEDLSHFYDFFEITERLER